MGSRESGLGVTWVKPTVYQIGTITTGKKHVAFEHNSDCTLLVKYSFRIKKIAKKS